ncbi:MULTISPECIES: hypothetical protein [Mammaliicoccus]|uniref:Phage protein n=1 Tax=Mammaliicoccus sciuri TaxID=1296 RepID=A0AB37HK06_MAMSC|nr:MULTISPECIES: hypothetical protein [Mammaliicoccus]MCE4979923.1 hypothetical protein [Mammaliicoccus sciuri]MCE5039557.1 hypothetical protein [Mammaliicoccus sciuri]MCE5084660.1 hypothetical protein [Mammaliicoccus sciuri]MCE5094292.1 hypothetical protein [Mammaliicoccus sciuri]MEB5650745.1 hypothetical protein [Mammaliicoccus sciuri]
MLTMELIEYNDEIVTYNYYPEDNKELTPGQITKRRKDKEIIDFTKTEVEKYKSLYFVHAASRMRKIVDLDELPKTQFVAWG